MNETRALLHQLVDRIVTALEVPTTPVPIPSPASELQHALEHFAEGRVSLSVLAPLRETPEGKLLEALATRVCALVEAGRSTTTHGPLLGDTARSTAERVADAMAKQVQSLERVAEQARAMATRMDDLARQTREVGEGAERASLLALNTGIEAIRVNNESARALASLGDELRKLCQRAAEDSRGISKVLTGSSEQLRGLGNALEEARNTARVGSEESAQMVSVVAEARRNHQALQQAVASFTVHDNQSERLLAQLARVTSDATHGLSSARDHLAKLPANAPARISIEHALNTLQEVIEQTETKRG